MSQIMQETDEQIIRLEEAGVYLSNADIIKYKEAPDVLTLKPGDVIPSGYKKCGHCGKFKKLYLFNRNKSSSTNCTGNCKECQKETSRKSYDKLKGTRNHKEYYAKNREKKLASSRQYYQENKDKVLAAQKKYHKTKKGQKAMQRSHAKRRYLLEKNAGIPYTTEMCIDRDKMGQERPICILCNKPIQHDRDIHMEHLIPVVMGGKNCFTNVGCAHSLCNLQKSKDAREITTEQVDSLIERSEQYMDEHPELFKDFFDTQEDAQ